MLSRGQTRPTENQNDKKGAPFSLQHGENPTLNGKLLKAPYKKVVNKIIRNPRSSEKHTQFQNNVHETINNETTTRQFPDLGQDVLKYGGVKHVCEISTLPSPSNSTTDTNNNSTTKISIKW